MRLIKYPDKKQWAELLARPSFDNSSLMDTVRAVLDDIKTNGDIAVREYEQKFDKVNLSSLLVTEQEIDEAEKQISQELKSAINVAKGNIVKFHSAQNQELPSIETMPGVKCWQKAIPIEKVGLYIPGGTAPLFSTVLMLALPAQIAGCKEIVLCSPQIGRAHV